MINFTRTKECDARQLADENRFHLNLSKRRGEQTQSLLLELEASDLPWRDGENIRKQRMSEIQALNKGEEERQKYLYKSQVVAVERLGIIVGTLRFSIAGGYIENCKALTFRVERNPYCFAAIQHDDPSLISETIEIEHVNFVAVAFVTGEYGFEVADSLETLEKVEGFEFVNGLYMDHEQNWVYIHDGERYLATNHGSVVVSCPRCGKDKWVDPKATNFHGEDNRNLCDNHVEPFIPMLPVRMDDLSDRWMPFWRLVDGPKQ